MSKAQKGKVVKSLKTEDGDDKNPISTFFTNTSYKLAGSGIKWSKIYQLFEEGTFRNEHDPEIFEDVAKAGLYKVARILAIFPYNDMVHWIIFHTTVKYCTIVNSSRLVVGSFRPGDIIHMYKPLIHQIKLDQEFLENFKVTKIVAKETSMVELGTEDWWDHSLPFKPR